MKTMEKHMLKIVIFAIPGNENIALSSERPAVCDWRARAPARAGCVQQQRWNKTQINLEIWIDLMGTQRDREKTEEN